MNSRTAKSNFCAVRCVLRVSAVHAALLLLALPARAGTVRVQETRGGPQIHVDGKIRGQSTVRPRTSQLKQARGSVAAQETVARIPGLRKEILEFFSEWKSLCCRLLHDMRPDFLELELDYYAP